MTKDYKLAKKRGKDLELLLDIIEMLAMDKTLPEKLNIMHDDPYHK